jgi:SAM-dependent methyltransferase
MANQPPDYNRIAPGYDTRYQVSPLSGIETALRGLRERTGATRLLEAGCGTGHWLAVLSPLAEFVVGLDLSPGMLRKAQGRGGHFGLVCGRGGDLPFAPGAFDLLFMINAFHFIEDKPAFLKQARQLLRPGGAVALVGLDARAAKDRWFIYQYFEGTYETDLKRFPNWDDVPGWMEAAGFEAAPPQTVDRVTYERRGRTILSDHFLEKTGSSELASLSDAAYQAGVERVKAAIAEAEARGEKAIFTADLPFQMVVGRVR